MAADERLTWLGHATVALEIGGARLLTDPLLRDRIAHLRRHGPSPDPAATADLDAVLVSHLHRDHLDVPSLRRLDRTVAVYVPRGAGAFLERLGFTRVRELAVGEEAAVGGARVRAVTAIHDGRRSRGRGGAVAEAIGFEVRGASTVYFAGDTDVYDGMAALAGRIDVALLPVWGWGPTLGPGQWTPCRGARGHTGAPPHRRPDPLGHAVPAWPGAPAPGGARRAATGLCATRRRAGARGDGAGAEPGRRARPRPGRDPVRARRLSAREARVGRHRYGLVLAFVVMSLVWSLIVPDGAFTRTMAFLLAGATLAIGVVTSEAPRRTRHAVAAALVVLVAAGILFDAVGSPGPAAILAATALLSAATIAVMAGGLVRLVLARGVVVQAVLGAVAVYLLVGLTSRRSSARSPPCSTRRTSPAPVARGWAVAPTSASPPSRPPASATSRPRSRSAACSPCSRC